MKLPTWQLDYITLRVKTQGGNHGNIHANHGLHLPDHHHPVHHRTDRQTAMRGKPIICRLMIPDGNGYREWHELTDAEKEAFRKQCVNRMGQAMNDRFGRNIQEYQKL